MSSSMREDMFKRAFESSKPSFCSELIEKDLTIEARVGLFARVRRREGEEDEDSVNRRYKILIATEDQV